MHSSNYPQSITFFLLSIKLPPLQYSPPMSKTSSITTARSEMWRGRLGSALRTTLACTVAGCTSLYGPAPLRRYLEFPSFMYVTTVLVVSDATLGDTVRGFWHVVCSNIQVMMLSAHIQGCVAALAMAASALVVGLPESTHLVTKQLSVGQLVKVFVSTVVDSGRTGVAVHPVHVLCSFIL